MTFAAPEYLKLFLVLPFSLLILMWGKRIYQRRMDRMARPEVRAYLLSWVPRPKFWLHIPLQWFALALIILALARPRWDFEWQEVRHKGSDIMLVLDISQSMMATDVSPHRLEKAKRAIQDLLNVAEGDRIGLILFAGVAFIQCPLTYDKAAFEIFLQQAKPDLLPVQGTAVGKALDLAGKALAEGTEAGSRGKTVILISDGEDHEADAAGAAQRLADSGVMIHSLGIGGESGGAPIPLPGGGFLKDAQQQLVLTRPNIEALASLAEVTGGRLLSERAGDSLDRLYREEILGIDSGDGGVSREKLWREEHMWLSGLAALLLSFDFLLGLVQRRKQPG